MQVRKHYRSTALAFCLFASSAHAQSDIPGWKEFIDSAKDLPDRMLAQMPQDQRDDPRVRQEIARLALSVVSNSALRVIGSDPRHPVFLPSVGNYFSQGQPNADTIYRAAQIEPGGIYRLRGKRGTARIVRIAQSGPRPAPSAGKAPSGDQNLGPERLNHDLNTLKIDADGNYQVLLSATRPAGYEGEWWQLQPNTDTLMIRIMGADWAREVVPTFSIERLDTPAARSRPPLEALRRALASLPPTMEFTGTFLRDHMKVMRAHYPDNQLHLVDFSQSGGLKGQVYYEGAFNLTEEEALILETDLPKKCLYRSLLLTNQNYETIDWYNNHSSLNDTQDEVSSDGKLRVVISARDPGVVNWLDTTGYQLGAIQGRWTECDSQPVPTLRKIRFSEIAANLPKDTKRVSLAQREEIIRARRTALQQRPLW